MRLYKVGTTFYYRRRYKKKLFRISLRTKDLRVAIYRKKLLDFMEGEKLFKLESGDYTLLFEYDTPQELEYILKLQGIEKFLEKNPLSVSKNDPLNRQKMLLNNLSKEAKKSHDDLAFVHLEVKFVETKKKAGKVSTSTYKAYASTFAKLKEYFRRKPIEELTIDDFEDFQEFLKTKYKLKNKTINGHMTYVNLFLDFAVSRKLISENPAKSIESLKEEKGKKENFTDTEVLSLLSNSNIDTTAQLFFNIAAYSGMRLGEIYALKNEDIKEEDGVLYFDIKESKTDTGIRKVPVHTMLTEKIHSAKFPLFPNKSKDATQKFLNRQIDKIIKRKKREKSFHTFRATFIKKAADNTPDKIILIQDVVGHSKNKKDALTIDTYAKGFSLELKKKIVDSVTYK